MNNPTARQHNTEQILIRPGPLWFGLLAGPVAWGTQLLVDYYLSSLTCAHRFAGDRVAGQSWFTAGIFLTSLLAALLTITAGLTAWSYWRRLGGRDGFDAGGVDARQGFMALSGLLLCSLFLLLVVVSAIPVFVSSQCATE